MAVTEAGLQASIQAKGYGTDSATAQVEAIKSVWRRVNGMKRWTYLEAQATITATVGNATVALTSITDLGQVNAIRLTIGTEILNEMDYQPSNRVRDALARNTDAGLPYAWTEFAGSLLLYPKPDRAYTVTVDYTRAPVYSSVAIVFPDVHQDVLVWGAIAEMAYRQREYTAAAYADSQYRDRLTEMIRTFAIEQRQSSLEVTYSRSY